MMVAGDSLVPADKMGIKLRVETLGLKINIPALIHLSGDFLNA
jgi:hypothetical protein